MQIHKPSMLEELKLVLAARGAYLPRAPGEPMTRAAYLSTLSLTELARYLQRELDDGVPVDWVAWLEEVVE